ncbi:MAG TPA: heavy metal-binding domain-containing protein [Gallionella sp.]|nr:heavy metal-binding domain-containing protein [Gallionella sp.]
MESDYICPMHPQVRRGVPGTCPECGMVLVEERMSVTPTYVRSAQFGLAAFVAMLALYFGVVGLISGVSYTLEQFTQFWYFIVTLALGFGVQIGLYTYLRNLAGQHGASKKVVAVSGTTSTAAMVSCCAHYLANILPILGVAGFFTLVAQYQVELFWMGLAFNAGGILYIFPKVIRARKEHEKC